MVAELFVGRESAPCCFQRLFFPLHETAVDVFEVVLVFIDRHVFDVSQSIELKLRFSPLEFETCTVDGERPDCWCIGRVPSGLRIGTAHEARGVDETTLIVGEFPVVAACDVALMPDLLDGI